MDSGLRRNDEFEHFSSAKKCFAKASVWNLTKLFFKYNSFNRIANNGKTNNSESDRQAKRYWQLAPISARTGLRILRQAQ